MEFFRRLSNGLLALLLFFSTVFLAVSLTPTSVTAAPVYNYTTISDASICQIPTGESDTIAIIETDQTTGGTTTSYWCLTPNTAYEFTRNGSSSRIGVASTAPDQGSLQTATSQSAISIGNASVLGSRGATTNTSADGSGTTCEEMGMSLGWLACPLIGFMSSAIGWLDDRIQAMLNIGEDRYTNPKLHAAWVNFRNIAYSILIPIMLIMVIGTAIGVEVFNAYTIKKALPRMVFAVIFITLSWHITTFMIGFFNAVGEGLLGLVTAPFENGSQMTLNTLFGVSSSDAGDVASSFGSGLVQWAAVLGPLLGLVVVANSPGGIPILLLYLMPVIGLILAAFLVLVLREIFILAGILLAPLAILAWIFPGNDSMWKLWWNTFSKLLIMFPLIMVIIGAGRIAAYLIDIGGGGGIESVINPLLKLTAYVLPYMFIPFAFKFAGGLFANLAGMVNDREKGLFDRMKKNRAERVSEYAKRGGTNSIFDPLRAQNAKGLKGRWMRGVNQVGGWVFDPINNANVKLGTEKGKAVLSQVWQTKADHSQKLAELMGKMGFNAEELSAISLGRKIRVDRNGRIEEVTVNAWDGTGKDLERIASQLSSSMDAQDRIGGKHLAENSAFLTQVIRSEEFGNANTRVAAGLAYAAQGFATPDQLTQLANYANDNVGSGVGSIIKTQAELMSARAGGLGKPGYTVRVGADGKYYAPSDIEGAKIEQVIRTGVQDFSAAKGSQLTGQLEGAIRHILTASPDTTWVNAAGDVKKISDIKAGVEDTLAQVLGSYAAPDVKRRVSEMLTEVKTVNYVGGGMSEAQAKQMAEQEIQAMMRRSSGYFNQNEYNAAQQAQAQQDNNQNK